MGTNRRTYYVLILLLCATWAAAQDAEGAYIWRVSTGGRIRGRPAVSRDGTVYVLSEDRHMYALIERSGAIKWRAFLGGRPWDSLCIGADGTVYTVLKDGDLVAVNRSGGVVWRFKARGLPVGNPAANPDGTIYFALDTGFVYAVSHTGAERWRTQLPAPPSSGPAVGPNGDVYVGAENRHIYALTPSGGARWNALLAGVPGDPAISFDGTIYVGTDFGSLVALEPSGPILWDILGKSPFLAPVIGKKMIFAATHAGELFALDFEGNEVWHRAAPEPLVGPLVVTAGNDILAMSGRGRLLRYRSDGEPNGWLNVKGSGNLFTVSPSGKYIFARPDWLVYAYQGSLPLGEGWPQPGRDPGHTSNLMAQPGSVEWLDQFRDDVEFVYLEYLVGDQSREAKQMALAIIEDSIFVKEEIQPYLPVLLGDLASEGTIRTQMESGRVLNDYPDIRSSAAQLLGQIGTLQSGDLLIRLLTYEYDSAVQQTMIRALGELMSDRTGLATAAISSVVFRDLRGRKSPDPRLAAEALHSVAAIYEYHGEMPHESGYEVLFEIYRGAYPREVREFALEVLRHMRG